MAFLPWSAAPSKDFGFSTLGHGSFNVGVRNARSLVWITTDAEPIAYAQGLYANFRTLDAAQTSLILVEVPPMTPAWEAINDRLGRAAVGSGAR